MKLQGWHIDGYGVHADRQVLGLPDGLTVVHGPNESGKTTLQDFLVGMLFGFTAVNRPDHHAPLRGGTYGGRLFLEDATGRALTISRGARRSSVRITGPEGDVAEGELAQVLGGATRDLYQSIFAVHTEEVAELKVLTDDQVRDRVFSAGILGAGRTAQAALGQLADGRDALFKPGGRGDKYLLKHLRSDLVGARAELAAAQQRAQGLPALTDRLDTLDAEAARLATLADQLRTDRGLLQAVSEVWELWVQAEAARRHLAELGPVAPTSAEVRRQLHAAEDLLAERVAQLQAAAREEAAAQEALATLAPAGPIVDHLVAVSELAAQATAEEERLGRIAALEDRTATLTLELDTQLRRLGPTCDRAWLAAQPADVEAEAALRSAATAVATARREEQDTAGALRTLTDDLAVEEAEVAAMDAALAAQPAVPLERAQAGVEQAVRLVALVGQRDAARHQRDTALAGAATASADASAPAVPSTAPRTALWALAAFAGAGSVAAIATGSPIAATFAIVIALGLAGIAWSLGRTAPTAPAAATPSTDAAVAQVAAAELARTDAELAPVLAALGLPEAPSAAQAASLRAAAERLAADAADAAVARRQAEQRRHALDERRTRQLARLQAQHAEAERHLTEAQAAWQAWLAQRSLPATLDPDAAAEHLAVLERARTTADALDREQAELRRLSAASVAFAEQVVALAAELPDHVTGIATPTPVAVIRHLASEADAHQQRHHHHQAAEAELHRCRRTHAEATARHQDAAAALGAVLATLGATDLADAHARVEVADRAAQLAEQVDRAEMALASAVGNAPQRLAQAKALLAEADPQAWAARLATIAQDLAAANAERDHAMQAAALAQQEADDLRRSADVPRLELVVADLEAQLADAVREWAALTVAHQLVEGTLARYQRERQPHVVQRAGALFAQITGGRYPRLEVRDRDIIAIDHAGREVPAAALSRGTIEQLYLCMRFALAESFAATTPLPILLDDVTINADGERSPRLAQTIASVAQGHQVLVFTCHQETVAQLTANVPDARVIELPPSTGNAAGTPFGIVAG